MMATSTTTTTTSTPGEVQQNIVETDNATCDKIIREFVTSHENKTTMKAKGVSFSCGDPDCTTDKDTRHSETKATTNTTDMSSSKSCCVAGCDKPGSFGLVNHGMNKAACTEHLFAAFDKFSGGSSETTTTVSPPPSGTPAAAVNQKRSKKYKMPDVNSFINKNGSPVADLVLLSAEPTSDHQVTGNKIKIFDTTRAFVFETDSKAEPTFVSSLTDPSGRTAILDKPNVWVDRKITVAVAVPPKGGRTVLYAASQVRSNGTSINSGTISRRTSTQLVLGRLRVRPKVFTLPKGSGNLKEKSICKLVEAHINRKADNHARGYLFRANRLSQDRQFHLAVQGQ